MATIHQWIEDLSQYSSLHGLIWYSRTRSKSLQVFVVMFSFIVVFGLPVVLIQQSVDFYYNVQVMTSLQYKNKSSIVYPNITVCSPRFFDVNLMAGKISIIQ